MGDDLNYLVDEDVVWGDLRVPSVDELFEDHGDDGVQLKVDLVGARQRR